MDRNIDMDKNIILSIIIPLYNSEKYIGDTMSYVLPQMNENVEVVLINDGSLDDTYKIVKTIKEENKSYNIIVLDQTNQGCSAARNYGVRNCSGKYITFVDSDDVIKSDYIGKFLELIAQNPDFDICITGVETYNEEGELYEKQSNENRIIEGHCDVVKAIMHNEIKLLFPMWCKIIRRDFLDENSLEFYNDAKCMSDGLFYSRCYPYVNKLVLSDYVGYEWHRRDGSIGSRFYNNISELASRYTNNLEEIFKSIPEREIDEESIEWLYRVKRNRLDGLIRHIERGNISKQEKRYYMSKAIDRNFDIDVIEHTYTGCERTLMILAKKNSSYVWYEVLKTIKKTNKFGERVRNAIVRRVKIIFCEE